MRDSVDLMSDESTCAIRVSPVQVDLSAARKPLFSRSERLRFAAIVALCVGFHAALLLVLDPQPEVTQVEEAIPVEVIVEPPPEEPAPQPEPEKEEAQKAEEEAPKDQPAKTIDEKPATDFARAADQDVEDGNASEQSKEEAKAREDIRQDVEAAVEPPPDVPPEKTAPEVRAAIEPPPPAPEPEPLPEAIPEPLPPPPPAAKPLPRFTGFTPLPEFQFKQPLAKRSEFPKGSAEPGYLSTLYGMIMRKMPSLPNNSRPMRGRVTFAVMSNGHIYQEAIVIPSGLPLLDAAALGAVRRAAPFPAPPQGGPVYIRFDYGSK
jgi:TonB family protein